MRDLHKNHKKTFTTLVILGLVILSGLSAGMLLALNDKGSTKQVATTKTNHGEVANVQPAGTIRFTAVAGKTVLEQLQQTAGDVKVKESSYGSL